MPLGKGDQILMRLPEEQVLSLAKLSIHNPGSTWHLADCGCCICVHPDGDPTKGWIIGPDGDTEYREHREES